MEFPETMKKLAKIAGRADAMKLLHFERFDLMMDLEVANDTFNLRLDALLEADNADFRHDIIGIQSHIDRRTKTFQHFFVPRFAGESK